MWWIAILAAAILITGGIWWWRRRNPYPPGSFRWYIQRPAARKNLSRMFEDREKMSIPDSATQAEIWEVVESLLTDNFFAPHILDRAGSRIHPSLIRALTDKRFLKWEEPPDGNFTWSPIERVLDLLESEAPPRCVDSVLTLVSHHDESVRENAACLLASTGDDRVLTRLYPLLDDASPDAANKVACGLKQGLEKHRVTPVFAKSLGDRLFAFASRHDLSEVAELLETLISIDRDHVVRFALDGLRSDAGLGDIGTRIDLLNKAESPIATDITLAVLARMRNETNKFRREILAGKCLMALAFSKDERLPRLAESASDDYGPGVTAKAANALLRFHNLHHITERIWDEVGDSRFDNATLHQRNVFVVLNADAEINNGGITQFFYNSAGNRWPQTLIALDGIGATKCASILRAAVDQFGSTPPSTESEQRDRQMAKLSKSTLDHMDTLSSQWYADDDRLHLRLARYIIANADKFRRNGHDVAID